MAGYISGYSNTMDVAGFGFNTTSAMFYQSQHAVFDIHQGVQCDGCGANPLKGIRWHCKSCLDHDVCGECHKRGVSADHPFEIMSMTSTNNANALANGGRVTQEPGVHWTRCQGCGMSPIKGTLYTCTICPKYDMCQSCNTRRIQTPEAHPHRFDFNYIPQACNPPPDRMGSGAAGPQVQGQSLGPPQQAQQWMVQQEQQQMQGHAPPPPPYYEEPIGTGTKIYNWLQYGHTHRH